MEMTNKTAYHLISCNMGKLDEVLEELGHLNEVKEFQGTCGPYDIIAKVESQQHLQKIIAQKIRTLVGVRSALTLKCKPTLQ